MAQGDHHGALAAVYRARSVREIERLYDDWAATYEAEMASAGYRHPSICLALFARHVPKGARPVLDAGAGTGLVGDWLGIVGYPEVEALDISEGMLAVAASKRIYAKLHRAALGEALPFADGTYAAIIAAGVFTTGHAGPEGLDELVRICRPGGTIVLTVKLALWEQGFAGRIAERIERGDLSIAEETRPYVSMPGETGTTPSMALALRIHQNAAAHP